MRLLKILIIFILILFPFGELLRSDVGNHLAWKTMDVLVFSTVIVWAVVYRKKIKKIFRLKYVLFPFIGFIALLLNLYWLKQNEAIISSLYLVRWVMYAGLFLVVREFPAKFKQKIKIFLLIDGLLMVMFGFLQYFFFNSLHNLFFLGWDNHLNRVFSTFLDPNYAGGFFVLYCLLVSGLWLEHIRKPFFAKHKALVSWCLGLIITLTILAVFLTFSRSSILMFIAAAIIFFMLINKKKLIIGLLLGVMLFAIIASPYFGDENMNLFRINSTKHRLLSNITALTIIKDRPIFGVGFNSYRYTKRLYGLDHDWINAPSHADAGADNSFLFVLATTGIAGFSAYAYLWFLILKQSWFQFLKKRKTEALIVLVSAGGLFVHALFINSLFYAPFMLWMWILIALQKED